VPKKAQDDDLVMSLVEKALARPPEGRELFLQDACGGDAELLGQVWGYVQLEDRMNGFLLDPLFPPPSSEQTFEPGEMLDGRFRIIREVAQGGMGVVYEAADEKLHRRIAIKCAKAGFGRRLPPEVRNASEISHPNVCKIFEIHTASTRRGEIDFITMEFLDGETLAERLRRGPPPQGEMQMIARQLCQGLAEAHRNQVIHGDLKSNNIILTKGADGAIRAVITDFGLAQRTETAAGTAQSETRGGTPDYMAPELLQGGKASVASDVYALGVILRELASGRRSSADETSSQDRLTRRAPPFNSKWNGIVGRCLDPDPARRFHSAEDVAQAFVPRRSGLWLLAAAAAALIAAATGWVTYQRATAPLESVHLALLPLESDPSLGLTGLSRDTSDQLSRLSGNNRIKFAFSPLNSVLSKKVDSAATAQVAFGATHVLRGTLRQDNDRLVLHAYLTDTRSGVDQEWTIGYAPGEARYVPVALAGFVTKTLRLPPLENVVAVNAAAKQDYLAGLAYARRSSTIDAAIPPLERAVAADPDSPLTHAGLADAEWLEYKVTQDKTWLDRAERSAGQAEGRNPDLPQVHRIAGSLRAEAGRYEQAEPEYFRAIELNPKDGEAYRRLGQAYEDNNELDKALAEYRKAVEVEPEHLWTHQSLGTFFLHRARFTEAIEAYQKMVARAPELPEVHYVLALAYNNLGRFPEAEKELRLAIRLGDTSKTEHELGYVLMHEGKDQEAIQSYKKALDLGPETDLLWLNLGVSLSRVGRQSDARQAFQRGRELAEAALRKNASNGRVRSRLAYLYARLHDQHAQSQAEQAVQFWPNDRDTRWMVVATYEVLNRRDLTLALLDSSPANMLPGLLAELSRYPEMADLRKNSSFIQMMALYHVQ